MYVVAFITEGRECMRVYPASAVLTLTPKHLSVLANDVHWHHAWDNIIYVLVPEHLAEYLRNALKDWGLEKHTHKIWMLPS